jgi:signal transduction histidine kinase
MMLYKLSARNESNAPNVKCQRTKWTVIGLGLFLQVQGNSLLSLLATGLITIIFQPLRQRLQQTINYLVRRERDDPYTVQLTTSLRHLTESLQQARERLVTAREEERRRLRRDLHDGLGPTLASLTFKIDAVRNLLTQDSTQADTLLVAVRQQTQAAITEIRRLVYDLRPPALDELGLLAALYEQAADHQHQGLEVVFDTPALLPSLPAAIEVAIYRIAQEALTNVARHAQAQRCLLRLVLDAGEVQFDIDDDGKGIPVGHRIGVGLHTMHERASELRGSCMITRGTLGGTLIQVRLPLPPENRLLRRTHDAPCSFRAIGTSIRTKPGPSLMTAGRCISYTSSRTQQEA